MVYKERHGDKKKWMEEKNFKRNQRKLSRKKNIRLKANQRIEKSRNMKRNSESNSDKPRKKD